MNSSSAIGSQSAAALSHLMQVNAKFRPVSMANERVLPVHDTLASLLPDGGLRRGTVLSCASTSLALTLIAEATQAGSWCVAVGLAELGFVAAAQRGVALERMATVPYPADQWAKVTAALIDSVDLVLLQPVGHVRVSDARRLTAKAKERDAVLIVMGTWPEPAHIDFQVRSQSWSGVHCGHGLLESRQLDVTVTPRRGTERIASLWCPDASGNVCRVADDCVEAVS